MPNGRLTAPAVLAALPLLLALPAAAHGHRGVSIRSTGAAGCAGLEVTIDGRPALRADETLSVPGKETLRLASPGSGGIRVTGWDRADFEVTACKAAGDAAALAGLAVSTRGGTVSVAGSSEDALVSFLVKAPRGASLDLSATNGPLSVDGLEGTVEAKVTNGPLSLRGVQGTVRASATNGPVRLVRASGDVTATAVNGPLTVVLAESRWNGKGLSASTVNGPVTLELPPAFASAVRVTSAGHVPLRCKAAACAGARRSGPEGGDRVLEIGSGEPVVTLSTVNGPLSVRDLRSGEDDD